MQSLAQITGHLLSVLDVQTEIGHKAVMFLQKSLYEEFNLLVLFQ